jgi:hypothetical protein
MIFAWIFDLSVVIARESGRSSNHKIFRDYWMPRFRGMTGQERATLSKGITRCGTFRENSRFNTAVPRSR